jgi:hypothetical protein
LSLPFQLAAICPLGEAFQLERMGGLMGGWDVVVGPPNVRQPQASRPPTFAVSAFHFCRVARSATSGAETVEKLADPAMDAFEIGPTTPVREVVWIRR